MAERFRKAYAPTRSGHRWLYIDTEEGVYDAWDARVQRNLYAFPNYFGKIEPIGLSGITVPYYFEDDPYVHIAPNGNLYEFGTAKRSDGTRSNTIREITEGCGGVRLFPFGDSGHSAWEQTKRGDFAWGSSPMTDFKRFGAEETEEEEMTDYEKKYNDLVAALEVEATQRQWCTEWKRFKEDNGIVDAFVMPPEPDALLVKFGDGIPYFRVSVNDRNWRSITVPEAIGTSWEALVGKFRNALGDEIAANPKVLD